MPRVKPASASPKALRALLAHYGATAEEAAELLHYKRQSIYASLSRGMRLNDYELLEYKLAELYPELKRQP